MKNEVKTDDLLNAEASQDDALRLLLKKIGNTPLLEPEREAQLFELGDEGAKQEIVNSYMRLVVAIAKTYVGKGRSFLELIETGRIGLIKAAEKYDRATKQDFSTYATWWIRRAFEE